MSPVCWSLLAGFVTGLLLAGLFLLGLIRILNQPPR